MGGGRVGGVVGSIVSHCRGPGGAEQMRPPAKTKMQKPCEPQTAPATPAGTLRMDWEGFGGLRRVGWAGKGGDNVASCQRRVLEEKRLMMCLFCQGNSIWSSSNSLRLRSVVDITLPSDPTVV